VKGKNLPNTNILISVVKCAFSLINELVFA